jgi:hypothetical protein
MLTRRTATLGTGLDSATTPRLGAALQALGERSALGLGHDPEAVSEVHGRARHWLGVLGALVLDLEHARLGRTPAPAEGLRLEARARDALEAWRRACLAGDSPGSAPTEFVDAGLGLVAQIDPGRREAAGARDLQALARDDRDG